jgi:hypothetical protein
MIFMQIAVLMGVIVLFKLIPDRKIASIFATLLFISLSATICYTEFNKPAKWKNPLFISSGFFLFLIAIPLAITRFLNWDTEFSQIKILWIEGPLFHSISNYFFILMTVATIWNLKINRKSQT